MLRRRTLKIAVYSERRFGCGASVAASRLAEALAEAGNEVRFFHNDVLEREFMAPVAEFALNPFVMPVHPGALLLPIAIPEKFRQKVLDWYVFRRLMNRLKAYRPDVVSMHNNRFGYARMAALSRRYRTVWTMHDCAPVEGSCYVLRDLEGNVIRYEWKDVWSAASAQRFFDSDAPIHFVSPSQWLAGRASRELRGRKPVRVIANGINGNEFFPLNKRAARISLGLPEDRFLVLYLAGASAWKRKNFPVLREALCRLSDLPIAVVTIGGTGIPLGDPSQYGSVSVIRHPGSTDVGVIRSLYNAADVFCITSLVDNLPNTVLESLFCGTPVIGANAGGIPEMVRDGENGWLFDPRSPGELAARIRWAFEHPEQVSCAARSCLDSVRDRFASDAMAAQYCALFDEVAAATGCAAVLEAGRVPAQSLTLRQNLAARLVDSHTEPYATFRTSRLGRMVRTFRYRAAGNNFPLTRNERAIRAWKQMYAGRRMFIIGNGPSLNRLDLALLKDEITIGFNGIFLAFDRIGFLPSHYMVEDVFVAEDRAQEINALKGPVKWFGNYLRYCLFPDDRTCWLNVRMRYDRYPGFPHFSTNALREIWTGGTVSYLAMQLAWYLGCREVYLVGFDHHYDIPQTAIVEGNSILSTGDDPNHFHPNYFGKGYRWHDPMIDRMETAYRKAKQVFEADGRLIANATAGGRLEVFPRVEYRGLFR